MKNKDKNISSLSSADQEKILQYLSNNMNEQESHEFESEMESDPFTDEAMEGLHEMDDHQISQVLHHLNQTLRKEIKASARKKRKRFVENQQWVYFAVVLIILLIIVSFLIIKNIKN